jgi:hypothetical protein
MIHSSYRFPEILSTLIVLCSDYVDSGTFFLRRRLHSVFEIYHTAVPPDSTYLDAARQSKLGLLTNS